jgi:phage terminase large subunit-like protein
MNPTSVDGIPRMSAEVLEQTLALNPYIPHVPWPKQLAFLELECLDALFGGSAGGGKSDALLMGALMFADVQGYAALIVRRRLKDLELPGGLIDRSLEWLRGPEKKGWCRWNAQEHRWRFRGGGTLQFGYADKDGDERRYDGSEVQYVALDEAAHFTERQIVYFYERLRRKVTIPVPLRYRLGTTPGGPGHEYIKRKYVKPGQPGKAFVPADASDNLALNAAEYWLSLEEKKGSDPVRYAQMRFGDWDAVEGGRFKDEWLRHCWVRDPVNRGWVTLYHTNPLTGARVEVERFDAGHAATFQTYDPSASASTHADHFVVSTWKLTPKAHLVWWDCFRDQQNIPDQVRTTRRLYKQHRPQFIAVEKVLSQTGQADMLKESVDPYIVVRPVSPGGRDKLTRAQGAIILAESGRLFLPDPDSNPTFPLDDVRGELVRFTGLTDDEASDVVDTASYAVECLHWVRPGGPRPGSAAPFTHATPLVRSPYAGLR